MKHYASLNHNEYAVSHAVSRMKMPPVREYESSLISINKEIPIINDHSSFKLYFKFTIYLEMNLKSTNDIACNKIEYLMYKSIS